MAEKENKNQPKDLIEAVPEEVEALKTPDVLESRDRTKTNTDAWVPKTALGKLVKARKETDIDEILDSRKKILEPEIVDTLLPIESDLLMIGQAKGKFGGGKRRAWRQTQKKTQEGNVLSFSAMAVVGDRNGHVGIGFGRSKETLPSREKAVRNAKLNVIRVSLGFESPEFETGDSPPHTIPFKVDGKCGSIRITLRPAPRGTGLVIGDEGKKIMRLAGIKDIYAQTRGKTKTTFNLAKACLNALKKTRRMEE